MNCRLTRRSFLSLAAVAPLAAQSWRPDGPIIDTHVHLFAADRERFPLHPNAPYDPPPETLEDYNEFVRAANLSGTVIVHPEPYQDDHSYLEYCFHNEPKPGYFKGTVLLDAFDWTTPRRLERITREYPGRIVTARVHAMNPKGAPNESQGPIRNRDLSDPRMLEFWHAAHEAGLAIQVHMLPHHAPEIAALHAEIPEATVIIDHIGRSGMGTWEDFQGVLALAKNPNTVLKVSGLPYSSKDGFPFLDAKKYLEPAYKAFGADRMIWGGLGYSVEDFRKNLDMLKQVLSFASEADLNKIRGLTAWRLFWF